MSNQDSGNPAAKPPKGKTAARRKARSLAVQALYSWQIAGQPLHEIEAQFRTDNDFSEVDGAYFHEILHGVPRQKSELDSTFEPCLDRPLAEIDPVELAILRLSTYELRNRIDVPYKVVINEGIELAKTFGATDGHKFVNGVLDKLAPRLRAAAQLGGVMGEFELIRRFFAAAACAAPAADVALGIGDDCALLAPPAGEQLAVSTDTLVEGVHFPAGCDPFLLAQRALAVSASDLAAMGAAPLAFTLALTLPQADAEWLQGFARGLDAMARQCGLALVGGDTTRGPLSMTLTVFGRVPAGQALTRAGARPGDLLCVGGPLGEAGAALELVLERRSAPAEVAEPLLARYWTPAPQFGLGLALRGKASAALDISDGLLADCGHIARASGVALLVECQRLQASAALSGLLAGEEALRQQLAAGDDYVLVFTLPPEYLGEIRAAWPAMAVIGRVEAGQGVHLLDADGKELIPAAAGYQHFGTQRD